MIQDVGPNALPIVSIISFLVGLIVAYMGAVQLAQFGAQIYIADLVAIGMVREMGALMTGIIMAGRTGAAFAAQLGTMQVNEEIDAFKTMGIAPMDFLVLPRMLALILMMPLLTLYSGIVGMLAGLTVAVSVFDISVFEYYQETVRALDLRQFAVGHQQGHGVWHPDRHRRLSARYAVRPQRPGGRSGHHVGGGHQHRVHCDRRIRAHHSLPAAGDLR